ncbi:hypothetical protein CW304_03350 [Bacillus sp. UFRGS-B20]|nr:hypothetical protein CW304_03350 [Bacillus sp. UFRGS-B20]
MLFLKQHRAALKYIFSFLHLLSIYQFQLTPLKIYIFSFASITKISQYFFSMLCCQFLLHILSFIVCSIT